MQYNGHVGQNAAHLNTQRNALKDGCIIKIHQEQGEIFMFSCIDTYSASSQAKSQPLLLINHIGPICDAILAITHFQIFSNNTVFGLIDYVLSI